MTSTWKLFADRDEFVKSLRLLAAERENALDSIPTFLQLSGFAKLGYRDYESVVAFAHGFCEQYNVQAIFYGGDGIPNDGSKNIATLVGDLKLLVDGIKVFAVQINQYNGDGIPDFVDGVLLHEEYVKGDVLQSKYGGAHKETGEPVSNTKVTLEVFDELLDDVNTAFLAAGGGNITVDEWRLFEENRHRCYFFPTAALKMQSKDQTWTRTVFEQVYGATAVYARARGHEGAMALPSY